MSERAALAVEAPGARDAGTSKPAIAIEALERRYGERLALSDVSLTLERGLTLGVLGSNGAGKSTLLRVLATLLRPHAGSVRVLGAALPAEADSVRARVGFLGHEPLLYRELSARENLRFHARLHDVAAGRVGELLAAIGLERRASDPVRELSRGMAQRVGAARAVLHDPELLLLDEPRSGLDPAAWERLEPLIGRSSGRTRVLVTHDVEAALSECDAVLGLRAGRVEYLGPPADAALRALFRP